VGQFWTQGTLMELNICYKGLNTFHN